MNTKPIIFSAPMINALLDGRKTQTRRAMKPQPDLTPELNDHAEAEFYVGDECIHVRPCPYGQPGDLLWVRETFSGPHCMEASEGCAAAPPSKWGRSSRLWYWADGNPQDGDWTRPRPSIHMPRWASRLTLQLTDVRVQRLQEISEADACAEGLRVFNEDDAILYYSALATEAEWPDGWHLNPVDAFRELWQSINGSESWGANSWIWALSFRVIHANVDAVLADPGAHGVEVRNAA